MVANLVCPKKAVKWVLLLFPDWFRPGLHWILIFFQILPWPDLELQIWQGPEPGLGIVEL